MARLPVPFAPACLAGALVACITLGCGPTAPPANRSGKPAAATKGHPDHEHGHDHDHGHGDHRHPETLAAGLVELEEIATAVKKHLDAGARDKADNAVHMVGHLVDDLRGLLPKEKLSAEAQAAAGKALDDVFDAFDVLDSALHAADGKGKPPAEVHASVADKIAAALMTLKGIKEAP